MKLLSRNKDKYSSARQDCSCYWQEVELDNGAWIAFHPESASDNNVTTLSRRVDEFLLDNELTEDYAEFEPKFSKSEVIINNFFLMIFTVIAATLAVIVSPVFILSLIKTLYRKLAKKEF